MSGFLRRSGPAILAVTVAALAACGGADPNAGVQNDRTPPTTEETSLTATSPTPPITTPYGGAPEQFGVLHLPDRGGEPVAVVVLVHGGFWRNAYDLTLMDPLADDLVGRGFAVWNIEYRRLGDEGGGWPGTLADVAAAVDHLATIAEDHPIGLARVAIVGHSAGGHLALWAAGRAGLPDGTPGASPAVIPSPAIGQGAVVDLLGAAAKPLGNGAVMELLGGTPDEVPERYEAARPRLDAGPRMVSVVGADDDVVPPPYSVDPARPGAIEVIEIDRADHMSLIDPTHESWAAVVRQLDVLLSS